MQVIDDLEKIVSVELWDGLRREWEELNGGEFI